jgi:glycosyltransferase involved in cell wall biosynthesis
MRIGNTLLRLADAGLAPATTARAGLSLYAPWLVEAILACDPDVVFLDVSWGGYLKELLEIELPGKVVLRGERRPAGRSYQPAPMNPSPKVSIVLPTHNGSKYLGQSIRSCLDQRHSNLELIIVDDGSTEDLRPVVSGFSDSRLRYVKHEKNRGVSAALNTGFALASGDYLTWTSDDNFYDERAIGTMMRFLQNHPGIDFVYASSYIVDESKSLERLPVRRPQPPDDLRSNNCVGACFMYSRQVYRDTGDYNSDAFLVEDYDYWVRVSKRFRMQRIFEPLYYYRYHDRSLTARHSAEDVARRFSLVKQQNGIAQR